MDTLAGAARATAHPEMSDLCAQFDRTFPFEETEDQLQAIDAVAGNLSDERPMDRIICGDGGFGKAEVARRAAFRGRRSPYRWVAT